MSDLALEILCLDCATRSNRATRCTQCGSPRIVDHPELFDLGIAHVDCDAFYAAVEKRDNPALADVPLIIGGGRRGVVSTACYIARIRGVRSAMPMFKALKLCPEAEVIPPRMSRYVEVSRAIRNLMDKLTPAVEPLSLDEAFLDLQGTERLHGAAPAVLLVNLLNQIDRELGVTASVGLSHNKFLAKLASDFDKPRGFSIIGRSETLDVLEPLPVGRIWGVGAAFQGTLEQDGIRTIADVRRRDPHSLMKRFGQGGDRLWRLAHGEDLRRVSARTPIKSISHETTFFEDTADADLLDGHLWRLAEKVADRAKARQIAGRVITLKLRRADFRILSRRLSLQDPTCLTERIYTTASPMLQQSLKEAPFRLIGVGLSDLVSADIADRESDMLDSNMVKKTNAERATDRIRNRFGPDSILKGRSLR